MKNTKSLKIIFISISLLLNLVFAIELINLWQPIRSIASAVIKPIINADTRQGNEDLKNIEEYINSQIFSSESEKLDFIRVWVYTNSIHKIDSEHDEYAINTPKVISMLWATHQNDKNHAHLSCGPRALAMKKILDQLEIPNRIVMVFTDDNIEINSHTFLEVFNRETNKWEIQDPDFNVTYISLGTQERVTTAQLVLGNPNSAEPVCGSQLGWEGCNVKHLKEHFFEVLMYASDPNIGKSIIIINVDRFNAYKTFEGNGGINFYQFSNENYNEPQFLELRGASEP